MTDPYRIRDPEIWRQARDAYLAGATAEAVCRRYDLGLSCFRRRARRFGWRRRDHEGPVPDTSWDIYDGLDVREQVDLARRRFFHALTEGRAMEARRWRELWNALRDDDDRRTRALFPDLPFNKAEAAIEDALADEYDEDDRFLAPLALDAADVAPRIEAEPDPSDAQKPSALDPAASDTVISDALISERAAENVHDVHSLFSSALSGPPPSATPPDAPSALDFRQRLLGGVTPALTPFGTALSPTPSPIPGPLTPENLLQARLALECARPSPSSPPDQPSFRNST